MAEDPAFIEARKADLCASLQHTIVEILLDKLVRASKDTGIRDIAVAGGVSANSGLRDGIVRTGLKRGWRTFLPPLKFTTDNAAMIAMAGYYNYLHGDFAGLEDCPAARIEGSEAQTQKRKAGRRLPAFCVPLRLFLTLIHKRMKSLKIETSRPPSPSCKGGMGVGISLSGLASAVASEGGIGVISSAGLGAIYSHLSKDYRQASIAGLREELRKARAATKGIIGVNVMVAMSNFADMVRTAVAEKADIIFSGAGLRAQPARLLTHRGGPARSWRPSSRRRARRGAAVPQMARREVRLRARRHRGRRAQGAGGHLGKREQIEDANFALERIPARGGRSGRRSRRSTTAASPVIAGGGIYTGEDIYRIMQQLGADGVQMGTFVS